jgi:hypothetical protein
VLSTSSTGGRSPSRSETTARKWLACAAPSRPARKRWYAPRTIRVSPAAAQLRRNIGSVNVAPSVAFMYANPIPSASTLRQSISPW